MIYVCIEFCAYGFAPPLLLNLSSAVIEVSNVLLYVSLSSAESKWYLCCLERSFIVPYGGVVTCFDVGCGVCFYVRDCVVVDLFYQYMV